MKKKSPGKSDISFAQLEDQIKKDKTLFDKLPVNLRKARREELEAVWPKAFLPEAEDPELRLE